MLQCLSEPTNFPLSVSPHGPGKEMRDRTRQTKNSPTSVGIESPSWVIMVGDHCGNVNVNQRVQKNVVPLALRTQMMDYLGSL